MLVLVVVVVVLLLVVLVAAGAGVGGSGGGSGAGPANHTRSMPVSVTLAGCSESCCLDSDTREGEPRSAFEASASAMPASPALILRPSSQAFTNLSGAFQIPCYAYSVQFRGLNCPQAYPQIIPRNKPPGPSTLFTAQTLCIVCN